MSDLEWLRTMTEPVDMPPSTVERMRVSLLDHIANAQLRIDLMSLVKHQEPTRLETARMHRHLSAHLEKRPSRGVVRKAAVGLAAVVAVITVVFVAATMVRTDPAEAVRNVAEVVSTIPDEQFTGVAIERRLDQTVLVVEPVDLDDPASVEVAFLLPITEIRRTAPDGSFQKEEAIGDPVFFAPIDQASASAIRQRYDVGQTRTSTFPPSDPPDEQALLTDDPALLARRIDGRITRFGPPEIPRAVQVVSMVASIYQATLPTASERAALLEVLASTLGLEYPTPSQPDTVEVAVDYSYEDGAPVRLVIVFDQDGWLIEETESLFDGIPHLNVPPGTPAFDRIFTPPVAP